MTENPDSLVSPGELAEWFVVNGLAEDRYGYGHATGEQIAEAILDVFDIRWRTDV